MRTLPLWVLLVACSSSPPAHPDAAIDAARTTNDGPFPCASGTCDKATQYCYQINAGYSLAQPVGCTTLPAGCGGQPSCACVTPTITDCVGGLACDEQDGAVTATCNLP